MIELDGGQQFANEDACRRDRRKDALLQKRGYFVLRFLVQDIGAQLDHVLDMILRALVHLLKWQVMSVSASDHERQELSLAAGLPTLAQSVWERHGGLILAVSVSPPNLLSTGTKPGYHSDCWREGRFLIADMRFDRTQKQEYSVISEFQHVHFAVDQLSSTDLVILVHELQRGGLGRFATTVRK